MNTDAFNHADRIAIIADAILSVLTGLPAEAAVVIARAVYQRLIEEKLL